MTTVEDALARGFGVLSELLAGNSRARPASSAMIDEERSISYAELDLLVDHIAASMQRDGGRKGDVVAIVSGNSIAACAVFLGALRAGCVPAPMAPSSSDDQLRRMIADCDATHVFVDARCDGSLLADPQRTVRLEALEDWLDPTRVSPEPVAIEPDDSFNIIYSSGTTGVPKGIVQSHGARWSQIAPYVPFGIGDGVMMIATPIYSNTTLVSLLPTLALGGTVALQNKFEARSYVEFASRVRATHAMLVPAQLQRIMALPDLDRFDLTSFRLTTTTSAPFSPELKREVLRRWTGELLEIYGMTEGGGTCLLPARQFPGKLHTVGRPAPGNDIRIIGEDGTELRHGEVGEIVGRSSTMMKEYHGRAGATEEATWRDADGNRFIRHGDLGYIDEDGFLVLAGRLKDMIISGGFNVYPTDLETVAMEHPHVSDAAVVGIPSERWGESPFLFYVERSGGIAAEDLLAWVNERVGRMQRLAGAKLLAELPRNALGKVLKRDLREMMARGFDN